MEPKSTKLYIFLILPSESLLAKHKHVLSQKPGLHDDLLNWMYQNVIQNDVQMRGSKFIDEMAVQQNLHMSVNGNEANCVGFVELGDPSDEKKYYHSKKTGCHTCQPCATIYFSFIWWLPVAICLLINASDLFNLFWKAVSKLTVLGFEIDYLCMDGPSANRYFIKLNNSTNFQTKHLYCRDSKMTFLMYYSHVIKMIRNNISSSGHGDGHTRSLSY